MGSDPGTARFVNASADEEATDSEPTDHMLVLGAGELTAPVLEELELSDDHPVVIVTSDPARAEALAADGGRVILGDPSDEAVLERAGVKGAYAVVVATNDDAADALAVLTARHLAPRVRIVAAATNRENVDKLKMAGADVVVNPASLGGQMLVRSALEGMGIEDLAEQILAVGDDR
ncbi:MAG: NAD(P)-binding protein [Halobacteriales archaeon]|nr:NAD(P)-binding protein [Halobacteriales archaeon]